MALKDCSVAECLVVADRFARHLDSMAARPGFELFLELIEKADDGRRTTGELKAFLDLIEARSIDEPTTEELEAMLQQADNQSAKIEGRTEARGHTLARALKLLQTFEAKGAIRIEVTEAYVYLLSCDETGQKFPVPITRISRAKVRRAASY